MSPIWIIEDHRRLRETVREALELAGEETVATFPSCEKALAALDAAAPSPGVMLLDLGLPGMSSGGQGMWPAMAAVCERSNVGSFRR